MSVELHWSKTWGKGSAPQLEDSAQMERLQPRGTHARGRSLSFREGTADRGVSGFAHGVMGRAGTSVTGKVLPSPDVEAVLPVTAPSG